MQGGLEPLRLQSSKVEGTQVSEYLKEYREPRKLFDYFCCVWTTAGDSNPSV